MEGENDTYFDGIISERTMENRKITTIASEVDSIYDEVLPSSFEGVLELSLMDEWQVDCFLTSFTTSHKERKEALLRGAFDCDEGAIYSLKVPSALYFNTRFLLTKLEAAYLKWSDVPKKWKVYVKKTMHEEGITTNFSDYFAFNGVEVWKLSTEKNKDEYLLCDDYFDKNIWSTERAFKLWQKKRTKQVLKMSWKEAQILGCFSNRLAVWDRWRKKMIAKVIRKI